MSLQLLLPVILIFGVMFMMTRSQKKKQEAASQMRNEMQPGTGVRTIGGMYATVKEIQEDTVLLEVAPGVHAVYAKNAIGAVLDDAEYNRIVHGDTEEPDSPVVPDDASSLTDGHAAGDEKIDLDKKFTAADADAEETPAKDVEAKDAKNDGDTGAK
ncbi:preprotein translocase subunit YajC [Streptomyces sp. NBC_00247]|uniref:preprotein translocase subunit YajC n=1 Tax=Streptomyces sp. NBC_00247 TaxID=2975689 RepID=UPI002E2D6AC1|nr:preprotein translocase subunit YajC [Streptomyces sp. NBC_00247]